MYVLPVAKDQVTVVLPVLNEEAALGRVIEELRREGYNNILVVDGYSKDQSVDISVKNGVDLVFQHGGGKTGAVKTAIDYVKTPYLLLMDGDYTYCARDIERLLNHGEQYSQVVGVRNRENISLAHRFGNSVLTGAFNLLFGSDFSDVCSGMYLFKTDVARKLELKSKDFRTEVEILAQMATEHRVTEVPINYRNRIGKPRLSTWRSGFQILRAIVDLARRYNPIFLFSAIAAAAMIPAAVVVCYALYLNFFVGVFEFNWLLFGSILFLVGVQGLTVATVALLLKRMEKRILRSNERTDVQHGGIGA